MAIWPYPSSYPAVLDNFSVAQIDNVDIVWANHPNSLGSAVMALQAKLNVANGQLQGTGGLAFDPVGQAANPAAAGAPSLWVDNSGGPGFPLMYTDDLGSDYNLLSSISAGFLGYGYACPMGMAAGQLACINGADSVTYASATAGLRCNGMVINVYGGGVVCDIAYRAEVTGLGGLIAGATYYLGDAGAYVIEAAIPVTATVKQMVGTARSASTMVVNPTLETGV